MDPVMSFDFDTATELALTSWLAEQSETDFGAIDLTGSNFSYSPCESPPLELPLQCTLEEAINTIAPWQLSTPSDIQDESERSPSFSDTVPTSSSSSDHSVDSPAASETSGPVKVTWVDAHPLAPTKRRRGRPRKIPGLTNDDHDATPKKRQRRKRADKPPLPHNVIEERYRVKLGNTLQALQIAIPTLRDPDMPAEVADEVLRSNTLTKGLRSTHKRNKATVCAKAVEYIQHLEAKVRACEGTKVWLERDGEMQCVGEAMPGVVRIAP